MFTYFVFKNRKEKAYNQIYVLFVFKSKKINEIVKHI